jgi:hypothetical protein
VLIFGIGVFDECPGAHDAVWVHAILAALTIERISDGDADARALRERTP